MFPSLFKNFILCGIVGWCLEIVFTALDSIRRRELTLRGMTSLWMFPIYGMASFLSPLFHLLQKKSVLLRGFTYTILIFTGEYVTGYLLKKRGFCPWNYSKSKWNLNGLIRLDFIPNWFLTGLLYERLILTADSFHNEKISNP